MTFEYCVADSETDPFEHGQEIKPFCWCVHNKDFTKTFWGENATRDFIKWARDYRGKIYAHNGGRFDWIFSEIIDELDGEMMIINGRIARAKMGRAELRDSFLCLPVGLAGFTKGEINYEKMKPRLREKYKREILEYLISDCVNLYKPLTAFFEMHGQKLTQASAALMTWEKMGGNKRRYGPNHDMKFRPYYFGGRTETFKHCAGKRGKWQVVDINSAYPYAMTKQHPLGTRYYELKGDEALKKLYECPASFWTVDATSRGALPIRDEKGSVRFPHGRQEFKCTGWEIIAGLKTETITLHSWSALFPEQTETMKPYVDRFIKVKEEATEEKKAAEARGDEASATSWDTLRTLAKLILNSLYGKYGANPEDYKEFYKGKKPGEDWLEYQIVGEGENLGMIWQRPATNAEYFDVALAASITGHARAQLWEAICGADDVAYCDTDSMICADVGAIKLGPELGAWDLEAVGDSLFIAGKKLYCLRTPKALYDKNPKCGWKMAHKGVKVGVNVIKRVANGSEVVVKRDAPAMKLDGTQTFIARTIKRTY